MRAKVSAGILLWRATPDLEVLLVHPGGPYWAGKDLDSWSIPKGEPDDSEDLESAARREFAEETGFPVPDAVLLDLGSVVSRSDKTISAWAVEGDLDASGTVSNTFEMEWPPRSGKIGTFPENDRAEWFSIEDARPRLRAPQNEFLGRLVQALAK